MRTVFYCRGRLQPESLLCDVLSSPSLSLSLSISLNLSLSISLHPSFSQVALASVRSLVDSLVLSLFTNYRVSSPSVHRVSWSSVHRVQSVYEVVQSPEVPVLAVPLLPGNTVVQCLALHQRRSLAKVNEPDLSALSVVVDEEEGTPNDLGENGEAGFSN